MPAGLPAAPEGQPRRDTPGPMPRSTPVDGFTLAYERSGSGPAVVLLHGWPGDRGDYRALAPLLAGYDIGSRIAQALARSAPHRVRGLVLAPPLPGVGDRVLAAEAQREFWYQAFHQLELAEQLVDGDAGTVRSYLRHFWSHWSGPTFELAEADFDRLVEHYAAPGAFTASIGWYRAGSGTVATSLAETTPAPDARILTPARVLWPAHDPLFPPAWSDRLDDFFADADLTPMPAAGHFSPLEAPEAWGAAISGFAGHG